ncbi:MAG: MFS transporter [Candidatus Hydrogenedentes bacterium]|nr:MFS transporter [Candidatus Hydrogenedentota bacterium]
MSVALKPLNRDQHIWRIKILLSTYLAYAGFYLVRKVFGSAKPVLMDAGGDYGFSVHGVAYIWTAYLVAYMIGQFVNSFVGRKYGPRALLLGGLGLSIAINVVFGFANSLSTFIVFMFFNGLVQAAGWPGAVGGIAEWLRKKERGTIMGFWSTSYLLGNLVVKAIAGYMLYHYGVPYAFWGCTLAAFFVWWIVYFWQRDKPEDVGLDPIVSHGEGDEDNAVQASTEESVTFRDYLHIVINPIVPMMGIAYFCIKFLRYALDSWLPTFLYIQGMEVDKASYYSGILDFAGLGGAIVAGVALDWLFRGRWERITLIMAVGLVAGYVTVLQFGANPIMLAICFGLVGFMLYGPDTLLCGAAAVSVAGERNGVAVAGLVNGIGSIGPVAQELVIPYLMEGRAPADQIRNVNMLGLSMSVLFVVLMIFLCWQIQRIHTRNDRRRSDAASG